MPRPHSGSAPAPKAGSLWTSRFDSWSGRLSFNKMPQEENKKTRYLFICRANINRSPTAEKICKELIIQNNLPAEVSSAGISIFSFLRGRKLTKQQADEADKIFVMEDYMEKILIKKYHQTSEKIINLGIPDIYLPHEPELESILRKELSQYLP